MLMFTSFSMVKSMILVSRFLSLIILVFVSPYKVRFLNIASMLTIIVITAATTTG